MRLWQVVVWQLAVLAALTGLRPAGGREIAVLAVGGAAVLCSSVRIRGLTGCEWTAVAMRFQRARVRSEPASAADALPALLPSLQIRTHTDRAGNSVGIAGVGEGWSAAVRLAAPAGVDPAQVARVLDEAYRSGEIRLAAAQLVIWTVPPNPDDSLGESARTLWLAVRYLAAEDPQATRARGGGELGALRATASATFSLARRLDDAGYACSVLDGAALHEQLLVALGEDIDTGPLVAGSVAETWQSHAIAAIPQACYRPSYGADPLSLLGRPSSGVAFTCESYTLRRRPRGRIGRELIVRAGALDPDAPGVGEALTQGMATALDRLDGRHRAYTRSTLPLALD